MQSGTRTIRNGTLVFALALAVWTAGCAARAPLAGPVMKPLALAESIEARPAVLERNHFTRDRAGSISEADLRKVLAAPVFLEERARVGIVQVADRYDPDADLPLVDIPARLCAELEDSAVFEVATEISTDWPADRGISGLRELAARYRTEYLLLYRHRFEERSYVNSWGWTWLTVVGIFAAPYQTLEAAGVMEATLFDVKTGTILFTVFERVHGQADENAYHHERKMRALKEKLLAEAADSLGREVVSKLSFLVAARPDAAQPERRAAQAGQDQAELARSEIGSVDVISP
ncbi:MAG: hypothetical protein JXR96_30135 [Deltaproteobacteria bacterium]|nr:hypothetical protein [Deltaproteobacteria bacterium]